ncbi:hypothetical protein ACMYR3_16980 (plasmid) [Ampullimonas aquatilis]|uniref:hypothetical protein n=1 Tax=Ampullimonas aquatilis TaxID=1341549 RepID=UPI003C7472CB
MKTTRLHLVASNDQSAAYEVKNKVGYKTYRSTRSLRTKFLHVKYQALNAVDAIAYLIKLPFVAIAWVIRFFHGASVKTFRGTFYGIHVLIGAVLVLPFLLIFGAVFAGLIYGYVLKFWHFFGHIIH